MVRVSPLQAWSGCTGGAHAGLDTLEGLPVGRGGRLLPCQLVRPNLPPKTSEALRSQGEGVCQSWDWAGDGGGGAPVPGFGGPTMLTRGD